MPRERNGCAIAIWLEEVKGIRVISHGGSTSGYQSNFFFVPNLDVGGVILTNADSGWGVADATQGMVDYIHG
jgi:hypothetical protein